MTKSGVRLLRAAGGGTAVLLATALLVACGPERVSEQSDTVAVVTPRAASQTGAVEERPPVTLYMSPSCTCCGEWGEHLRENGLAVDVVKVGLDIMQIKAEHGIAASLTSCHTALVGGYVIEGHVPADLIARLLDERPEIRGLAVPGMPPGVPGMPKAGPNRKPYPVFSILPDGSTEVFAER